MDNSFSDFNPQNFRQNILKKLNINSFLEINQAKFADSAGVSKNHMLKVLSGDTNNPGIIVISSIAKRLDCSIDELVGHEYSKDPSSNLLSKDLNFNIDLFKNSFDYVTTYIAKNNISSNFNDVITVIDSIYDYSFRRNLPHPDQKFSKWILSSTFED